MTSWLSCSEPPELQRGIADLWLAPVAGFPEILSSYESLLAPEERQRAVRFRRHEDAARYITGRGLLRRLLGQYLGIAPGSVRFSYGSLGKPSLVNTVKSLPTLFSLSHSADWILFGFVLDYEIGVDLEAMNRQLEFEELARRYFGKNELRQLLSFPPEKRRELFYCCWTRKEAFLKAQGAGLSYGLDQVEVTIAPDQAPAIVGIQGDAVAARQWSLKSLSPIPGYLGAAAVQCSGIEFRCFRWQ